MALGLSDRRTEKDAERQPHDPRQGPNWYAEEHGCNPKSDVVDSSRRENDEHDRRCRENRPRI